MDHHSNMPSRPGGSLRIACDDVDVRSRLFAEHPAQLDKYRSKRAAYVASIGGLLERQDFGIAEVRPTLGSNIFC